MPTRSSTQCGLDTRWWILRIWHNLTFHAGEHTLHLASATLTVHPHLESDGLHLLLLPPLGDAAEQVREVSYGAFHSHFLGGNKQHRQHLQRLGFVEKMRRSCWWWLVRRTVTSRGGTDGVMNCALASAGRGRVYIMRVTATAGRG